MTDRSAHDDARHRSRISLAEKMEEKQLQTNLLDAARDTGWLRMHPRRAKVKTAKGYRHMTPLSGEPGFWDLTLQHRVEPWRIETELKREGAYATIMQRVWLDAAAHYADAVTAYGSTFELMIEAAGTKHADEVLRLIEKQDPRPEIFVGVLRPAQWFSGEIVEALRYGPNKLDAYRWPEHR